MVINSQVNSQSFVAASEIIYRQKKWHENCYIFK